MTSSWVQELDQASRRHQILKIFIAVTNATAQIQGFAWSSGDKKHVESAETSDNVELAYLALSSVIQEVRHYGPIVIRTDIEAFNAEFNNRRRVTQRSHRRLLLQINRSIKKMGLDVRVGGCLREQNRARTLLGTLNGPSETGNALGVQHAGATPVPRRKAGRPKRDDITGERVAQLYDQGMTDRAVAEACKAGVGTVRRAHKAWLAELQDKKVRSTETRRQPADSKTLRRRAVAARKVLGS